MGGVVNRAVVSLRRADVFKPGDKAELRRGNVWEPVTFLGMAEVPLAKPSWTDPGSGIAPFPGPSPTANVRHRDGREEPVLLEDLRPAN